VLSHDFVARGEGSREPRRSAAEPYLPVTLAVEARSDDLSSDMLRQLCVQTRAGGAATTDERG